MSGNKNDELRADREGQEEARQELRDEHFAETGYGEAVNIESQDERRHLGDEEHKKGYVRPTGD